ncbi:MULTISPECIES: helix-turn-helix domain-containing protein [unclassified Streptomyces]|uniref:helix-turn-helix domain-containing protein n=1 Tax=unclassified Streptomyces TaxID=2593676 RepID=UPI00336A90CC
MQTVFQSDDLPAEQRFEAWREMFRRLPLEVSSNHEHDFHATLRLLELGPVNVSVASVPSLHTSRTERLIRRSDPEYVQMDLVLRGRMGLSQADRESAIGPEQMVIHSSWRPYRAWADPAMAPSTVGMAVRMPRALLPLPDEKVDRLLARPLSGREGIGGLLAGFLTRLTESPYEYRPSDTTRLGTILLDLVNALLAHQVDADTSLMPESRQRILLLRIQAFIQQNLSDPALTPDAVAAAHHISTSQLYRLFRRQDHSVAAWIRHQRLEHCRRDLADPAHRCVPIHVIATRWGFSHPADFSRAFRTAYGTSPRDYRHQTACDKQR